LPRVQHRPFGVDLGFFSEQPLASFAFSDRFASRSLVYRVGVSLLEASEFFAKWRL
jgi:hypothetical protein